MSTTVRARRRALLSVGSALAIGAGLLVACGPAQKPSTTPKPTASASTSASASASASTVAAPPMPKPISATALGTYGPGTFGPMIAHGTKGALVVVAPSATTGRRWVAQALDEAGRPRADAKHELAEAPEDTSTWQITALGDGFLLAWTRATDSGAQLLTLSLSADGTPQGSPTVVARGGEELVDVHVTTVPGADGGAALLTFGERSAVKGMAGATGTLYALPLDVAGRPLAQAPMRVGERLGAWRVSAIGNGQVAVALVQHAPEKAAVAGASRDDVPRSAKLVLLTVGAKGVVASDPLAIAEATVQPEIDVARLPEAGKILVLWTDRREIDEHVFSIVVDTSGPKPKLDGKPRRAVPPRGEQSIVSLVPTKTGPILLWEDASPRPTRDVRRRFSLARLSSTGEATSRPRSFWYPYDDNLPELDALVDRDAVGALTSAGDDVAMLTYGSACLFDGAPAQGAPKQAACDVQDLRPFVVRFAGPTLVPSQTDMIDVDATLAGGAVSHAYELTCAAGGCEVLAEGPTDPTVIALAKLPTRAAPPPGPRWVYTEAIDAPTTTPRLESATALGRESQFAGLHTARTQSGGAFVAWVTYAPDDIEEEVVAVKGKGKGGKVEKGKAATPPGSARVAARAVDATGEPLGPINVVSERALSKGDVAVAASAVEKGGGVVAYVSRGEGDEEVYVAKMDDSGKRTGGNVRVTHVPGGASDVALTALPAPEGGYLLAWVDARKSAPGVYAVRLDKSGNKQGAEVRVGGGAADLADVSVATIGTSAQGPKVAIVWSDARENASTGYADVWMTIVASRDLKATLPERALVRTSMHSHSPVVAARGDGGAIVGWLEDDPNATEMISLAGKDDWGAFVARIDGSGNLAQPMTPVALDPAVGKGIVSGVTVDCPPMSSQAATIPACHLALSFGDKEGVAVLATTLSPTPAPARTVWSYRGAGTQEASPTIAGSAIYLCEDGLEVDDGRVRRLAVAF